MFCKNCKHVSGHWCMLLKKGVNPKKDLCPKFKLPVKVRYEQEANLSTSW